MKKNRYQTMMILWKWEELTAINEKSWNSSTFLKKDYINNIEAGKGDFFDEIPVEWSEECPDAKVIPACIYQVSQPYKEEKNKNEALLDALLEHYLSPKAIKSKNDDDVIIDHQFMLFLHRGNNYTEKDIDRLFTKFGDRIEKVFLFANGRDFMYYSVRRQGLLDEAGYFFQGADHETGETIVIFDKEKNIIKQPYFDRAWQHYKIEFETKVFGLKEDLYECWLPFLLPDQAEEIEKNKLIEATKESKDACLYYRLKSFLDQYKLKTLEALTDFDEAFKLQDEIDIITSYEKVDEKSYLFDDCIINLENKKEKGDTFISDEYDEIRVRMEQLLFNDATNIITKTELRQLMQQLNYLVKIIPGVME